MLGCKQAIPCSLVLVHRRPHPQQLACAWDRQACKVAQPNQQSTRQHNGIIARALNPISTDAPTAHLRLVEICFRLPGFRHGVTSHPSKTTTIQLDGFFWPNSESVVVVLSEAGTQEFCDTPHSLRHERSSNVQRLRRINEAISDPYGSAV